MLISPTGEGENVMYAEISNREIWTSTLFVAAGGIAVWGAMMTTFVWF
jgi:hypothetical protein